MPTMLSLPFETTLRRLIGNEFLRNLGRYSTSTTASQFMMMIYTILVARALGPDQFGRFTGSYALTGLSIFVVNWGMDTWLLREAGSLDDPRAWSGRVLRIKGATGLVWGMLLVVVAPLIRPDVFMPELVLVCALDVWCDGALTTHVAALNIQKRIHSISRLMLLSRAARLIGALLLILLGVSSPLLFALARCVATAGGMLAAVFVLKPDLSARGAPSSREVLRMSIPYGLSEFLALIYLQADVTLLTILTGSSKTGIYSPASGLVNALFIIPSTVFLMVVPPLSRQYAKDPQSMRRSFHKVMLGFLGLGLALAVGVGSVGGWIVRLLLGPQYLASSILLGILSPLLLFKSLGFGWAAFLVVVGWQKQRLLPQAVSAAANVLFNLWAIPRLGVPGVAMVYVASEVILAIGYAGLVIGWLRANPERIGEGER